jgi:hypothetical protein
MLANLFFLDVAEKTIELIGIDDKVSYIRVSTIHAALQKNNPLLFARLPYSAVKTAMASVFPIYKNRRLRRKLMKIRPRIAYQNLDKMGLRLRPLCDIKRSPQ